MRPFKLVGYQRIALCHPTSKAGKHTCAIRIRYKIGFRCSFRLCYSSYKCDVLMLPCFPCNASHIPFMVLSLIYYKCLSSLSTSSRFLWLAHRIVTLYLLSAFYIYYLLPTYTIQLDKTSIFIFLNGQGL